MDVTQLFSHVGISTRFGKTRVRFTNNATREIILIKDGHDDITFFEMPQPMNKPDACTYILERKEEFPELKDRIAVDEAFDRYCTVAVVKSKAKVTTKATKAKPSLKTITARAKAQKKKVDAVKVTSEA
jgi:hypothetical protein